MNLKMNFPFEYELLSHQKIERHYEFHLLLLTNLFLINVIVVDNYSILTEDKLFTFSFR